MAAVSSVALYTAFYVGEGKLGASTLYAVIGALMAVWMVSFGMLLLTMDRKYIRTFVSAETGCEHVMSYFLDNDGNDDIRAQILYKNQDMWRPIRSQVQAWVRARFMVWKEEKPAWFSEALILAIPTDMLPERYAQQLTTQAGGQRTSIHDNASLARRMSLSTAVASHHTQVAPIGTTDDDASDSEAHEELANMGDSAV